MDIPTRASSAQRPKMSLPEIVFDSNLSDRFRSSTRSNSYYPRSPSTASGPIHIPNSRDIGGPPPALPPPRNIDISSPATDVAWQWGNRGEWGSSAPVKPGSSLYGSFARNGSLADERPQFPRKDSSTATIKSISEDSRRDTIFSSDEGYGTSISSQKSRYEELHSPSATGFQSSVHDGFRSSNAQAYDKSLLQKLDSRRGSLAAGTPPRGFPKSPFSPSANDASPTSRIADEHRQHHQLRPLSSPEMPKRKDSSDEFPRWGSVAQPVLSPREMCIQGRQFFDFKATHDVADSERSTLPSIRRSMSTSGMGDDSSSTASHSHRGSYDHNIFPDIDTDFPMQETSSMRRLHIDDPMTPAIEGLSPGITAGIKRRASSPPREDCVPPSLHSVGSASELFQRRVATNSRMSPQPYRGFHPQTGSVSSTSSLRGGSSYASNLSLAASSITTMSSYGRLSPGGLSPATDLSESPFLNSSIHSPTSSVSSSRQGHQRNLSENRPMLTTRKLSDNMLSTKPQHGGPRLQGIFICECCPKKPKKFDTQEELAVHEMEKQYECAYCRNRFKNKNEAERHQNSLHLRRHSWSCAALDGYAAAFHASPSALNPSDACGFCGAEFPRSGPGIATEKDWDIRIEHLQNVHKFGECNHAKKFFRADHFRQHLKHSHAGTSGKWTNMLENACMKDEVHLRPVEEDE